MSVQIVKGIGHPNITSVIMNSHLCCSRPTGPPCKTKLGVRLKESQKKRKNRRKSVIRPRVKDE